METQPKFFFKEVKGQRVNLGDQFQQATETIIPITNNQMVSPRSEKK